VKGQAFGNDGVVAPTDEIDEALTGGLLFGPCQVFGMAGAAEQNLHLPRPVLVFDLDQRLQFAQVMSVAQCVHHVLYGVAGLPVVMNHNAAHPVQHVAPAGPDAVERQRRCGRDMQPYESPSPTPHPSCTEWPGLSPLPVQIRARTIRPVAVAPSPAITPAAPACLAERTRFAPRLRPQCQHFPRQFPARTPEPQ
jgi:hypothetical protein